MQHSNQDRYDIAKSRLLLVIGHYAELIRAEYLKPSRDEQRISDLEAAQEALEDTDNMLSVEHTDKIETIIATYEGTIQKIMKRP